MLTISKLFTEVTSQSQWHPPLVFSKELLTTDKLFAEVTSKRSWYESLNYSKQYALNLKLQFQNGQLSDAKQQKILLKLGFEIEQPTIWKNK